MGQSWENLLFAHWPVDKDELRGLVAPQLELETFDGSAWIGVTPFRVAGLRLRGTLPFPRVSSFPELNVRTYVRAGGKPGIWFFSLDAASRLAVEAARRTYHLPYFRARMSARERDGWIEYESARDDDPAEAPFVFSGRYRPVSDVSSPASGSLEEFLTERYCLYAVDEGGRLCRAEIHHPPWPLQEAELELDLNTMAPRTVKLPDRPPLTHFASEQDVVIWPLETVKTL